MDSMSEVIVISASSSSHNTNCSIYDLKTGGVIFSFKEGNSIKKGLCFIAQDYIISALSDQPYLKVWTLSKTFLDNCKMVCPGCVTALAVSNCGTYCVAGIEKSFYVWEVPTGTLLTSLQYHSQTVTCLRFSSDGSHIISGGKDGMVLVWLVSELVSSTESSDTVKPRFVWMDHAAEVTDIHVGSLGIFSRVATASRDMTCRVYELETGYLLTTVQADYAITSVTMDESEYFLILGSAEGDIYRINLFSVNDAEVKYSSNDKKCAFVGHSKEITCLSVSSTGKYLLSGSEDGSCCVWDISNFSCIRKISSNGPVTNAFITLLPPGFKNETQYNPRANVCAFKRNYEADDAEIEYVTAKVQSKKLSLMHLGTPDEYFDSRLLNYSAESLEAMNRSNITLEKLCRINAQLYSYALSDPIAQIPEDCESQAESD